jgi:hypothetical protein
MRDITGNSALKLPMFITQMNSWRSGEVANQQLAVARFNLDKIILVGPKYQYQYADGVHLTNTYSKYTGEMNAKVIKQVIFDQKRWLPVMPTYTGRTNNIIKLSYHVPVGKLVIDTQNVALRANYGFSFVQTGGNSTAVKIQNINLVGKDIYITLNTIPTGSNKQIRYAWGTSKSCVWCGNANDSTSVGGNIRDQDGSVSPAKNSTRLPLYNWGVAFSQTIN